MWLALLPAQAWCSEFHLHPRESSSQVAAEVVSSLEDLSSFSAIYVTWPLNFANSASLLEDYLSDACMHYFQAILSFSHKKQMVLLKKEPKFGKIFFSLFGPFEICLEVISWPEKLGVTYRHALPMEISI